MTSAPFNTHLGAFSLENDPRPRDLPYASGFLQDQQFYVGQNSPISVPVSEFDPVQTPCAWGGLALGIPPTSVQLGLDSMTKWTGEKNAATEPVNMAPNCWMGFEGSDLNINQQHGPQSSMARPLRAKPLRASDLKDSGAPCGCSTPSSTPRAKKNVSGPFVCDWNGCMNLETFARDTSLWRHIKEKHLFPSAYSCPIQGCDKTYGRKDKVKEHMRSPHESRGGRKRGLCRSCQV